jgi:hypothetical protein
LPTDANFPPVRTLLPEDSLYSVIASPFGHALSLASAASDYRGTQ